MPKSSLKPCAKPGCGALVERRQRFCGPHGGNSGWHQHQQAKGNTTQRGYGHAWRKIRDSVLKRDKHLCQEHLRNGKIVSGNQVDHIVSKANGGTDEHHNLQTLCRVCHKTKTAHESRGVRQPE